MYSKCPEKDIPISFCEMKYSLFRDKSQSKEVIFMDEAKKSDEHAICTPFAPQNITARTYEGKLYYGTLEVAKVLGVTRQTVSNWHNSLFHDAPIFKADLKTHDGRLLYEIERVEQLKAVYRANWTLGSYEPALGDEKQSQINETAKFFHLLYGKIPAPHFAYLFTKHGIFSFAVTDETQRKAMALKAIELSDNAIDVWHSVNPVCVEPTNAKRGNETVVSYQIACVVDIDIRSIAHKDDPSKLAADFD